MPSFTDQLGRTILLPSVPQRIISLVPSQTELLYDLGLEQEVVGITKFCVHPEQWFRSKPRIGGTKNVKPETIHGLRPDLIIANKEENMKGQVEALAIDYPVWVSDIHTLEDALTMMRNVGELTGKTTAAEKIVVEVTQRFGKMAQASTPDALFATTNYSTGPLRTAYLIWKDPWMSIGGDTFIHDMLTHCGLQNVFAQENRYPILTTAAIIAAAPQLLLLSSEPYPFAEKHITEWQQLLPNTTILLVDGEMFSWYGSRLQYAPDYFSSLLKTVP